VKKTVNFDDPGTYHLYFGDEGGKPGTIITFFPWANAYQGKIGDGQVGVTSYVVPKGAFGFWEQRLERFHVPFTKTERFGEQFLSFDVSAWTSLGDGRTRRRGSQYLDLCWYNS
jgi:glyoxalase family protein